MEKNTTTLPNPKDWPLDVRATLRRLAGHAGSAYPIDVVGGADTMTRPARKGQTWHYVTESGDLCRYPSAYMRAGGRPRYVHSTHRIVVGRSWLGQWLARSPSYRYLVGQ